MSPTATFTVEMRTPNDAAMLAAYREEIGTLADACRENVVKLALEHGTRAALTAELGEERAERRRLEGVEKDRAKQLDELLAELGQCKEHLAAASARAASLKDENDALKREALMPKPEPKAPGA